MATRRSARREPASLGARVRAKWLTLVVHAGALTTLGVLAWRFFTGTLGVDEVNAVYYFTGRAALILLALSLAATPISFIFGYNKALTVRRPLGLYGFLFAALHFTGFLILDYGLDLNIILMDAILTKPYIVVGLLALLILLALAITSTLGWQRRLRRNWTRLHRLVYVAVLLAALHFLWQAKTPERWEPLIYGAVFSLLLFVRIPPVRQWFVQLRQRQSDEKTSAPLPASLRSRQTE